jgi:hypothetical protein
MPEIIQCQKCGRKLRIPDHLMGKTVKCPTCSFMFTAARAGQEARQEEPATRASAQSRPPVEDELEIVEDQPSKRGRSDERAADERPSARRGRDDEAVQDKPRPHRRDDDDEGVQDKPSPRRRSDDQDDDDDYDDEDRGRRDDDYDDDRHRSKRIRPRKRRLRNKGAGTVADWQKVRRGVTLVLTAILGVIGMTVVLCCGTFLVGVAATSMVASSRQASSNAAAGAATAGAGVLVLAALYVLTMIAYVGLQVTGNVFCLAAPTRNNARTLAIVSLSLLVLGLLGYLGGFVLNIVAAGATAAISPAGAGAASGAGTIISLISFLMLFAQPIVFLLLLRALAITMEEDGLAQTIVWLLMVGGLAVAAMVFAFVIILIGTAGAASTGPPKEGDPVLAGVGILALISYCASFILSLVYFIWYIVVLFQARSCITNHLGGRE